MIRFLRSSVMSLKAEFSSCCTTDCGGDRPGELRSGSCDADGDNWWKDEFGSRLTCWRGEISKQDLGLNTDQICQIKGESPSLAKHVHVIIHNGAQVHYNLSYKLLKATNVAPTFQLLSWIPGGVPLSPFSNKVYPSISMSCSSLTPSSLWKVN